MANIDHETQTRQKALANEYAEKLRRRDRQLKEKLGEAQYDFFKAGGRANDTSVAAKLSDALRKPDTMPSEYISKHMSWMFGTFIAERDRDALLYFADRMQDYSYSISYTRRSFRARNRAAYVTRIIDMIHRFGSDFLADIPLDRILNRELPEDMQAFLDQYAWQGCGYCSWQIAYALDRDDERTTEAVRRILTEENGSGMMTNELIRGILISRNRDFHALLGQLLLAARLQEGLRQAICENADCGTAEGFFAMLKVIEENGLIRYSSVKRAVGTWLGLLDPDIRDLERVSDKSVRLMIECLNDPTAREAHLASEDAMGIHIALWSYGFESIEAAVEQIERIATSGTRHQLLVAGYFTANLEFPTLSHRIARTVIQNHHDREDILAVWLPCLMPTATSVLWDSIRFQRPVDYRLWFDSKEEIMALYQLIQKLHTSFTGKSRTFFPCVFPWHEAKLAKSDFAELLCALAAFSEDTQKIDEACQLIPECHADHRHYYFSALLRDPRTATQRQAVLDSLADKESYTRRAAAEIAAKISWNEDEYRSIEEHLRFKSADIRKNVLSLLMRQDDAALRTCITRLLDSDKEDVRLGGLDMLTQLKQDETRRQLADAFTARLTERSQTDGLPAKEKLLIDALLPASQTTKAPETVLFTVADKYCPTAFDPDYTARCAETFTKYFPDSKLPDLIRGKKGTGSVLGKLKAAMTEHVACRSSIEAAMDLLSLSKFISEHKNDTFTDASGQTMLLGNVQYAYQIFGGENGKKRIAELSAAWVNTNGITNSRLIRAMVLFYAHAQKTPFITACAEYIRTVFGNGFEFGKELPNSGVMEPILLHLSQCTPKEERSRLASAVTVWFVRCVPDDAVMIRDPWEHRMPGSMGMAHLLAHPQLSLLSGWLSCGNDSELQYTFPPAVAAAERCYAAAVKLPQDKEYEFNGFRYQVPRLNPRTLYLPQEGNMNTRDRGLIDIRAYLIAAYRGIITEAQLFEYLLAPENIRQSIETVTALTSFLYEKGKLISEHSAYKSMRTARRIKDFIGKDEPDEEDLKLIRFIAHLYETVIPVMLAAELSRGDSPAAYTKGILGITRLYGAKTFAAILSAMGKDTLNRNVHGGWWNTEDRKTSLSYLLSVCIPSDTDTPDTLREALRDKKITAKRLIEAALFSPEWISLVGSHLGIDAFESTCYYFMAHMNEQFDNKRRAMIARFTPLTEDELNLGAFDVNWFRAAYQAIGEKEFELIYDAAKYITDGAKHARARKYADAALGKFDVGETEQAISDKRNKDLLMAYSLIPLTGEDDICRRYLYLQKFRKESKQFGAQRATNEGKAVETALKNLATNAGYSDTMRLTLRMETKVIDDSRALLEEQTVNGISLQLMLDDNGKASLTVRKEGKTLKSIPANLKKNETVLALNEMKKMLTEQYRRTRLMLEQAMEDSTCFTFGELAALSAHPVVYPMLKNLVLISGDAVGFLAENGLSDHCGEICPLDAEAEIRIAHPSDLYRLGCWRDYQRCLYDCQTVQPFRQIFRELYIKTADEVDVYHSLRYAGNQIQPAKTVAALKSRRWVADIESGLQKVYYKENIVAQIYALADWFSPADIEAPTLEWVCFSDRKTGQELKISEIPDILFSEVMRDVDLAVSVAHVGGVDPETSHSTIEMREALLSFVLPMFRIGNVRVQDHHAIIDGKLANYSVHLGSGTVHQIGGAMIPVLPVHSQHRGRIFLPFLDEDPKTAEIISKVLLFAEDGKIKDPMILSNIQQNV